ncbi:hypothetical protein, partial [Staphylococcus aureus]|uniref:hypothetical protein n=1 Tax=Staphylococcus aureus TaxID=1280 RepID=UPI001C828DFA
AWNEVFAQYQAKYPTEAAELLRRISGDLPAEFSAQADAFIIPADVYAAWDAKAKGNEAEAAWNEVFAQYQAKYPTEAAELLRRISGDLPAEF